MNKLIKIVIAYSLIIWLMVIHYVVLVAGIPPLVELGLYNYKTVTGFVWFGLTNVGLQLALIWWVAQE